MLHFKASSIELAFLRLAREVFLRSNVSTIFELELRPSGMVCAELSAELGNTG
jgi:hypothetical protein